MNFYNYGTPKFIAYIILHVYNIPRKTSYNIIIPLNGIHTSYITEVIGKYLISPGNSLWNVNFVT